MGIGRREPEVYHLLVYVEGSSTKLKKFKSLSTMKGFITKFRKKHPDPDRNGDNWIDFTVKNISGAIEVFPESCLKGADE